MARYLPATAKAHAALLPGAVWVQLCQVNAQEVRYALRDVVLGFLGAFRGEFPWLFPWPKWENGGFHFSFCENLYGKTVEI